MKRSGGKELKGHLAVVTGASSGIGLCFCRELAARGADLVMVSNERDPLISEAEKISAAKGVKAYSFYCDLTDPQAHEILLDWLDGRGLNPDIIINNAGIFAFNKVTETSEKKIGCFLDLHCRAVTLLSRAFARRFAEGKGGKILNMSSMSCWMPMPGIALYSATKAYIRVFSRALHYEMKDAGVSVTVACPGGIATSLFGLPDNLMRVALKLHAVQTPEAFVKRAVTCMLKGRKQYINGWLNRLSILVVGLTPMPARMMIKRKMLDKGIRR